MSAQLNYSHERRRRRPIIPKPVWGRGEIPYEVPAINTEAPEERPIVPPLEVPPTPTPEPFERPWTANDEIGRLGEVAANRRNAPIEDVPRWKAALMGILSSLGHVNNRPLERGESALARIAGAAAGGGITGAALPGIEGQRRKDVGVAQAEADYQRAIEAQKQVVGIETDQVMNRRREAEIPYIRDRGELERAKLESIDTNRDELRDIKREANESLGEYRNRTLGDRRAANESLEAYRQRMGDLRERGLTEQERHNKASEELGAGSLGVRQESNRIRSENVGSTSSGSTSTSAPAARRDRGAAQRMLNSARSLRARAAKADDLNDADALNNQAAKLEADLISEYPDEVEKAPGMVTDEVRLKPSRTAAPRRAPAGVKLSQAEILTRFANDPAKAAAAIKRAKSRGLL